MGNKRFTLEEKIHTIWASNDTKASNVKIAEAIESFIGRAPHPSSIPKWKVDEEVIETMKSKRRSWRYRFTSRGNLVKVNLNKEKKSKEPEVQKEPAKKKDPSFWQQAHDTQRELTEKTEVLERQVRYLEWARHGEREGFIDMLLAEKR